MNLEVARFVNLVQYWATRNMNEEQLDDFERRLTASVDGKASEQMVRASGAWSREAELSQFKQANG